MAKLATMFFLLIAIQACLLIYHNPTAEATTIWDFIVGMDQWNSMWFIVTLIGITALVGGIGIAATSLLGVKTDFLIFACAIPGFISMGLIFMNLARVVENELRGRIFYDSCTAGPLGCPPVTLAVGLTIGLIAFYYVWTIIEWWRAKDY